MILITPVAPWKIHCVGGSPDRPCPRFAAAVIEEKPYCMAHGVAQLNVIHTLAIEQLHEITRATRQGQSVMGGDREF